MSACTSEEYQITGFGIGADEYITKSFSTRVLTARVRAMFRRMEGLIDIVNNFYLYTPDGSNLFINASLFGQDVKLTISDNGNGISKKDVPYIFDLFYRGSASRGDQGMGMGLAVAKSIIDSHGWSISIANNVKDNIHTGACFLITIPVKV